MGGHFIKASSGKAYSEAVFALDNVYKMARGEVDFTEEDLRLCLLKLWNILGSVPDLEEEQSLDVPITHTLFLFLYRYLRDKGELSPLELVSTLTSLLSVSL
jgi:hypothetical protein